MKKKKNSTFLGMQKYFLVTNSEKKQFFSKQQNIFSTNYNFGTKQNAQENKWAVSNTSTVSSNVTVLRVRRAGENEREREKKELRCVSALQSTEKTMWTEGT